MISNYAEGVKKVLINPQIHKSSEISSGASIGKNVNIGAFSYIGPDVVIEDDVWIDRNVVVTGAVHIGKGTHIWPFATIGSIPQDLKFNGESGQVIIGQGNMIREYVNISSGTEGGGNKTVIGDNNLLMVYTHIGHDCLVGDNCVFANGVSLGGHVTIQNGAILGGHAAIHQFCKIGALAMLAGGSIVVQDVAPYCNVQGNRAFLSGLNLVGIKRANFPQNLINDIKFIYKKVFRSNLTIDDALLIIKSEVAPSPERDNYVTFIENSDRGLCR